MLEALDHADADRAAEALTALEPRAYRTFNMIVADNRDAFWLRHLADPSGTVPIDRVPLAPGSSMIAAGDLDDRETPASARYRPLFERAAAPIPSAATGRPGRRSSLSRGQDAGEQPPERRRVAMRLVTERGFGTVSSSLIALPFP